MRYNFSLYAIIRFIRKINALPFTSTWNKFCTSFMFYEYEHYRVFTLWSQMNGRMNRYKFFDQTHKMIWLLGQKKCIICILQSAIIFGIAL